MSSIPIPFVVAFMLVVMAIVFHRPMHATSTGTAFAQVIYLFTAATLLIGLRWSLDAVWLMLLVALVVVLGTSLLYLAFQSLERGSPVIDFTRDWPHLVPAFLVLSCTMLAPLTIDWVMVAIQLIYAALLARFAVRTPTLQLVRFSWVANTQKAIWVVVLFLIVSAVVDLVIIVDFALFDGRHAENFVGLVNLAILLLLGWVAIIAGRARTAASVDEVRADKPVDKVDPSGSSDIAEADVALLRELNRLMHDDQLFADSELNLQKLARKVGAPTRSVSRAVNSQLGLNVSQWVNQIRIEAACDYLTDPNTSVSDAMDRSGFMTKSNFNREFKRIKACSPSEWRKGKSL